MKKYGAVLALGLALLSGVAAVMLANRWLSSQRPQEKVIVKESVPSTKIVIAARDLEIGTLLTPDSLTLADWPKASVPRGAFEDPHTLEGRVAVTRLGAGQPILSAELAAPGSGAGLVATIDPGMRAMSIRVDEVVGVGGFVLPNTFVDIIAVNEVAKNKKRAKTILERIEVLAIAQETFTEEGKPKVVKTVTLELAPDQAEKLALQTHEGAIHLVLRNPADELKSEPKEEPPAPAVTTVVKKKPVTVLEPRVRVSKPSPYLVEIIRGSKAPEKIQFKHAESEERID